MQLRGLKFWKFVFSRVFPRKIVQLESVYVEILEIPVIAKSLQIQRSVHGEILEISLRCIPLVSTRRQEKKK